MDIFLARLKCAAWLALKAVFGVMYVSLISDGAKLLMPELGKKLYKLPIPFAADIENDEVWRRFELSHVFAVFLLIAVFNLWAWLLRSWLRPGEEEDDGWDPSNLQRLVFALAVVIIGGDAYLFYRSVADMDWSGGAISVTCIVATAAYGAVQIFVSLVSVMLHQQLAKLKKGNQ